MQPPVWDVHPKSHAKDTTVRIFLSHSSRQKPLIRAIRRYFPEHIDSWIDEKRLVIGDDIFGTLEEIINNKTDYLILFLDKDAATSKWVTKELQWAFCAERSNNRTMVLTVLIDEDALDILNIEELRRRRYISCKDFSERGLESIAALIVSDLFALVCRDLDEINNPTTTTKIGFMKDTDVFLSKAADCIMNLVFPHRERNPISLPDLTATFNQMAEHPIEIADFDTLVEKLAANDMLSGVSYDGYEFHILEEHYKWKVNLNRERKVKVARVAARLVRSGDVIALDTGSATDELTRIICKRLKSRSFTDIKIVTNSLSSMTMLLDMADVCGFEAGCCPFIGYLVGGLVRPNTRATVCPTPGDVSGGFIELLRLLGGANVSFIGVNGICPEFGLTTHTNPELQNKRDLICLSKNPVIIGDSSKLGIVENERFASFEDDITVIIDQNEKSETLFSAVSHLPAKLILA